MTYVPYTKETFPKGNVWISLKKDKNNSWLVGTVGLNGVSIPGFNGSYNILYETLFNDYKIDHINGIVLYVKTCGTEEKELSLEDAVQECLAERKYIEHSYREGRKIQYINRNLARHFDEEWQDYGWFTGRDDDTLNWTDYDFRIKPKVIKKSIPENERLRRVNIEQSHYINGKSIQCKAQDNNKNDWEDITVTGWNWEVWEYRVKPEKTWIPWTYETMPEGTIYIRLDNNCKSDYYGVGRLYANLCRWNKAEDVLCWCGHDVITFKNLFDDWRWTATPDVVYTGGGECCGTYQ